MMNIELHKILNVTASKLNCDDQGSPKRTLFGDADRGRLSSQSLKAAIRGAPEFAAAVAVPLALRTRWVVDRVIAPLLVQRHGREAAEATAVALEFVTAYYGRMGEGNRSAAPVYIAPEEAARIAQTLASEWESLVAPATQAATIKRLCKELARDSAGWTTAAFGSFISAR